MLHMILIVCGSVLVELMCLVFVLFLLFCLFYCIPEVVKRERELWKAKTEIRRQSMRR